MTYELLRRIYFAANGRKELFAEEIFVEYMRFLDGYHTRICGDEETKNKIKESLKESTNTIKGLLFNEKGKALFEEAMIKADPDWKCNSSHIKEIAGWIAAGYLGKTQLSYRLLELDKSGVLEMQQIFISINVLKSTIIAILFSHMGMDKELIRRIMGFDNELHWQTMCLREKDERPFMHPSITILK